MQPEQPDKSSSHYLSEKEAERSFRRNETLIEFARLFDYAEASDRAIAIIGPAFLDSLLRDILIEFMIEDEPEVNKRICLPASQSGIGQLDAFDWRLRTTLGEE